MTVLERPRVERTGPGDLELLFREARRRRRRRWFFSFVVLALTVALVTTTVVIRSGSPSFLTKPGAANGHIPGRVVPDPPRLNLDILSAQTQVSAQLSGSDQKVSLRRIAAGTTPAVALSRAGYVIGTAMGALVSMSESLQQILHSWTPSDGQYVAPASNPADVWLSDPYGDPSRAREFDGSARPVGPAVTVPPGSIVDGQSGSFLVLQGPPPAQDLELWNPAAQRIAANFGSWDQEAASANDLAWTTGSVLHLETVANHSSIDLSGPQGDWALSVSFSPDGRHLAVAWAPRPGTQATRNGIAANSKLTILDIGSGTTRTVTGAQGVSGPLAWTPHGTQLFFARRLDGKSNIESYDLLTNRSTSLSLPNVRVPAGFSAASGALIVWER